MLLEIAVILLLVKELLLEFVVIECFEIINLFSFHLCIVYFLQRFLFFNLQYSDPVSEHTHILFNLKSYLFNLNVRQVFTQ